MIIAYERRDSSAIIRRCFTYGGEAELPARIAGYPVTELGAYACSLHQDANVLTEGLRNGDFALWDDLEESPVDPSLWEQGKLPPALAGETLTELALPPSLRRIGAYAFYNCSHLRRISFHGTLKDLGAGLFTGCHGVRELSLTLDDTRTSGLREMLIEIPECLRVELHGAEEARLVFPEYFEESVENTPARILMIRMHGSGMNYRNCFYERRLDLKAYDGCFARAAALEDADTVTEMALSRLLLPTDLSKEAADHYRAWLSEHAGEALAWAVDRQDLRALTWLTEQILPAEQEKCAGLTGKILSADQERRARLAEQILPAEQEQRAGLTGQILPADPERRARLLQEAAAYARERDYPEGTAHLLDCLRRSGSRKKRAADRFAL